MRIVTDTDCMPKSLYGMECEPRDITLTVGDTSYTSAISPNEKLVFEAGLRGDKRVRFDLN